MKKGIEVWSDYDRVGLYRLNIKKKRGQLTLDEITDICMECSQGFYVLVIAAMDREIGQYYAVDDLQGDYVQLYSADDFFKWREKDG